MFQVSMIGNASSDNKDCANQKECKSCVIARVSLLTFSHFIFISMTGSEMTASGITIPEGVTTALTTQVSGLIASLTSWLPGIFAVTIGVVGVLFLFRLVWGYLRRGVKGR